ncbi:hypothetical protein MKX07_000648 [Trichoderma sp. CBMAI-0711]|uniref:Predicted protein n=3 Tax=Trichoderma TaxID=5543 RepID=G0R7W4_HYPJQ|nr:uncharacterized protein TRIREDRAFT_119975 [Trichoderma reesei QM6a]ETR99874.1 hypothetical protein M419DRAFT_113200 [Trichoderma reesei RUT C-30]KAH0495142.1 hypothetical protein TgHK011_008709 [Trichoderma gracile]KAK1247760.1 hypothetical protein MKX07_000648 [Trichoderma sp. CBMAI-0711]OTA06339.1 SSCRP protein [Trichoderma parareesei]EGR52607.1 predicted protein [Trichoderma reesei QM6a]
MKFTVAVALAAAGVSAVYVPPSNVTVVTEVVDVYTTYCPFATQITHGSKTYTVTEPTTLTISDCPCTITRPVTVTSSVACYTCGAAAPTGAVPSGNGGAPPAFTNSTITTPTQAPPAGGNPPASTGGVVPTAPPAVPTGGASKAVLSGAGLAGIVGLAAFVL